MKGHFKAVLETINGTPSSERRSLPRFERLGLLAEAAIASGDYKRADRFRSRADNEILKIRMAASQRHGWAAALERLEREGGFQRAAAIDMIETYPWIGFETSKAISNRATALFLGPGDLLVSAAIFPVSGEMHSVNTVFILAGQTGDNGGNFTEAKIVAIDGKNWGSRLPGVQSVRITGVHALPSGADAIPGVRVDVSLKLENEMEIRGSISLLLDRRMPRFESNAEPVILDAQ